MLVWFHGGGLASGMAGMYEPHFIMDYQVFLVFQTQNLRIKYCNYKVVVVTVNYRLGPWGELSLDSGRVSGNQGLRDQVCLYLYPILLC